MPRWMPMALAIIIAALLVPLALVARARWAKSEKPALHVFFDMDQQKSYRAQSKNLLFADNRAMRMPVEGTVARGELRRDEHYYRGQHGEQWVEDYPDQIRVDEELLARGRSRFDIYCAPCHGLTGAGDGMVARRADQLQEGTWTPPSSFHKEPVTTRPLGHIFNTITNGIRNMPSYGSQIPVDDRWAIVAYVRALQLSQNARVEDVPAERRDSLR